jgi:pimeloyl-ACP methyl ester carboxylesterase
MIPEPFEIDIPAERITDLQTRVRRTNWPDDLENEDWAYGFNSSYLRSLADTWANQYDWYAVQARMNEYPHWRVMLDSVPIHFMRIPGKGPKPIPLILTHGWPWTFWDMQRVIGPLTDPAAFGGDPADAFELIVPSLPGFAFSTPLRSTGINFWRTADLWHKLMSSVLGFERYAAAGGDWGYFITEQLGHKYASSLYGILLTGAAPLDLFNAERYWDISTTFLPSGLTTEARRALLNHFKKRIPHVAAQTIEPQTIAYAMHDSPVGLLAWLMQPRRDWSDCRGNLETAFSREHILTTATIYWVTQSFVNSARYYAEAVRFPWSPAHDRSPRVEAPTALTFLGGEFLPGMTRENRVEAFRRTPWALDFNVQYTNVHDRGGHFSFYEAPEACVTDLRAHFRPLRPR